MVLEREVGDRVECGYSREQVRMAREQEEALLCTHAAADRVDPAPVDVQPGERQVHDLRHPGEVLDLAERAPRLQREHAPLSGRADDGEPTVGR